MSSKSISLVLGSGGARGLAHIGVVRWLEQHNFRIDAIVGCSMGACIGGIYAIGKLDEYEQWVRAVRKRDILALMDVSFGRNGLLKGDRLFNTLTDLLGDASIETLPVKFTAVATDIAREREVWITTGPVFDAIRASVSIPLLFTPVKRGKMRLIDGAVLNPIPVAPTLSDQTDITVAVNASGETRKGLAKAHKKYRPSGGKTALQKRISGFLDTLKISNKADTDETTMSDVVYQSFDTMQSTLARQKLATYPPDALVDIPRNICNLMDFHRADELIDFGYEAAETNLSHLALK
ncbi:MAG: patatin-like phospholipase family protein [Pseudomonadota bacterium]